jgi:hypothetical protein
MRRGAIPAIKKGTSMNVQLITYGTVPDNVARDIMAGGPCGQCGCATLIVSSHYEDVAPGRQYNVFLDCSEPLCSTPLGRLVFTRPK